MRVGRGGVARRLSVALLVLCGLLAAASVASAAPGAGRYTCTGGDVPPGTYASMTITGVCDMSVGTVHIRGDLKVAPGGLLDDITVGDPASGPVLPATVIVDGNVWVGNGAGLLLGCSPQIICPSAVTYDRIGGDLTAIGALGVVVHSTSIDGNVSVIGGGGGVAGGPASGGCFTVTPPSPWSEDPTLAANFLPQYDDFEDDSVAGNLTLANVGTCWLGAVRNWVGGNATFSNDQTSDPDGNEIEDNFVSRDLRCANDDPQIQFGDGALSSNIAGGRASGECAFSVVLPNPAPEAMEGTGINMPISVSAWSLRRYDGTYTTTSTVDSFNFGTTSTGDSLVGALADATIAGRGLKGSVAYDSATLGSPSASVLTGCFGGTCAGSPGEMYLGTVSPSGLTRFTLKITCACSLGANSGEAGIEVYGTSLPNGQSFGTFLITSGPDVFAGPPLTVPTGGLGGLAGYGTFSSFGEPSGTVRLVEHLN
ncbi:MAG TPA: hypothetical protein VMA77_25510 [Solirubrobacteraceae bacterium]|nr:hypothetical protein [Solirubrobacteraceae bacterium]